MNRAEAWQFLVGPHGGNSKTLLDVIRRAILATNVLADFARGPGRTDHVCEVVENSVLAPIRSATAPRTQFAIHPSDKIELVFQHWNITGNIEVAVLAIVVVQVAQRQLDLVVGEVGRDAEAAEGGRQRVDASWLARLKTHDGGLSPSRGFGIGDVREVGVGGVGVNVGRGHGCVVVFESAGLI